MENQTRHQQWAYRNAGLQTLIEATTHNKTPKIVAPKQDRGAICRERAAAREGIICFYAKQYWSRVSDTRMKFILVPDAVSENEFLHAMKYLSMKDVFFVENVYAVDYKSMIGGYRTLLVMNSVNPLLFPLRYLNHV